MIHNNITKQIGEGLKVLRTRIEAANIPPSKLDETLNIVTWNIREFGKNDRTPAAIHYIAEILSQFDLITIIEVRDNLSDLYKVMEILGSNYKVIFSDFNPDSAGNRERMAFIYDTRAATFTGLAAESDPYRTKNKITGQYISDVDWWRSPYMASFRSGNFDFILLAVHIRWSTPAKRLPELQKLAEWVDRRMNEKYTIDKDIIVLGDFNTPKVDDQLFKVLTDKGLTTPKKLREARGTNLAQTKHFDHVLHNTRYTKTFKDKGGLLDFYTDGWRALFPAADYPGMTKEQFMREMSDHLPVWVQLDTWVDDEQLDQFLAKKRG